MANTCLNCKRTLSEFSADVNDLFGTESNTFANKMKMCRDSALQKAKDAAIRRECGSGSVKGLIFAAQHRMCSGIPTLRSLRHPAWM